MNAHVWTLRRRFIAIFNPVNAEALRHYTLFRDNRSSSVAFRTKLFTPIYRHKMIGKVRDGVIEPLS